jgi:hypothetical protein
MMCTAVGFNFNKSIDYFHLGLALHLFFSSQ